MAQEIAPILLKYKQQLDKNPRSAVFAPLAELYRKSGMIDEALRVLKNGIRHHPNYIVGYLTLAACYYDLGQYPMCYATLRPLVENQRDNIRLQSLFARACTELDHIEEALDAYKYLLFLNPRDKQVALKVRELEDRIEKPTVAPLKKEQVVFQTENIFTEKTDEIDEWQQVNFSAKLPSTQSQSEEKSEQWYAAPMDQIVAPIVEKVEAPLEEASPILQFKTPITPANATVSTNSIDEKESGQPMVTLTLVDLYAKQGHFKKAIDILEKIIELNPQDQKCLARRVELKKMQHAAEQQIPKNGEEMLLAALDIRRAEEDEALAQKKIRKLEALLQMVKAEKSERANR